MVRGICGSTMRDNAKNEDILVKKNSLQRREDESDHLRWFANVLDLA